jgi:hypothetical protein
LYFSNKRSIKTCNYNNFLVFFFFFLSRNCIVFYQFSIISILFWLFCKLILNNYHLRNFFWRCLNEAILWFDVYWITCYVAIWISFIIFQILIKASAVVECLLSFCISANIPFYFGKKIPFWINRKLYRLALIWNLDKKFKKIPLI